MMIHERCGFLDRLGVSTDSNPDRPQRLIFRILAVVSLIGILLAPGVGLALTNPFSAAELGEQDKKVAESIAAFPGSARRAAFIVAGYSEELLAIQKIQRASADDFAELIASYPREDQEEIWNLVRHLGLASEFARGGRKSDSELEGIASNYPIEDRTSIIRQGREFYSVWVRIYALELEVEQGFSELLADQSDEVRGAFDVLTNHPDLMSILIENMRMTTVLGALYRDDRDGIEAHFDDLHEQVASRQQEEQRAWSEEVTEPEAAEELSRAALAFAEAYDYDLDAGVEEMADSAPTTTIRIENQIVVRPYPYWFGYPGWYDVAYWYPAPVSHHIGFRFGNGHGYVSVGLPSPFFLSWYHSSYAPFYNSGHHDHHGGSHHKRVRYYEKHRSQHVAGRSRHHGSKNRHVDRNRRHSSGSRAHTADFRRHDPRRRVRHDARRNTRHNTHNTQATREVRHRRLDRSTPRHRKIDRRERRRARSPEQRERVDDRRRTHHARPSVDRDRGHQASSRRIEERKVRQRPAERGKHKARSTGRRHLNPGAQWASAPSERKNHRRQKTHSRSGSNRKHKARSTGRRQLNRGAQSASAPSERKSHQRQKAHSSLRSGSDRQHKARSTPRRESNRGRHREAASSGGKNHRRQNAKSSSRSGSKGHRHDRSRR